MRSLMVSLVLFACESWTLTAEPKKGTPAFEMRCYRRLHYLSYTDHVATENFPRQIQVANGKYNQLLTLVKKRKLSWFGHISKSSGLPKTILQGTMQVKGEKVDRRRGGKTILRSGQGRTLLPQLGLLKTGLGGK